SKSVSILIGLGNGSFMFAPTLNTSNAPVALAVGDFNGDGKIDLAVANQGSNSVSIFLGAAIGGTFTLASTFSAGTDPVAIAAADFNRDGKLDMASANMLANNVSVLIGDGSRAFVPWALSPFATGNMPEALAVADLNGDGAIDIVTANAGSNNVSALLSQAATAT